MSDTTTATTPDPTQQKEALKTEAAELGQDIKEAEQEAAQARKEGDDARAARLEASITETKKELGEVKALLKQLVERPFALAPGDSETPPAAAATGEQPAGEQPAGETPPPGEEKKPAGGKRHWLYGDRWNQE